MYSHSVTSTDLRITRLLCCQKSTHAPVAPSARKLPSQCATACCPSTSMTCLVWFLRKVPCLCMCCSASHALPCWTHTSPCTGATPLLKGGGPMRIQLCMHHICGHSAQPQPAQHPPATSGMTACSKETPHFSHDSRGWPIYKSIRSQGIRRGLLCGVVALAWLHQVQLGELPPLQGAGPLSSYFNNNKGVHGGSSSQHPIHCIEARFALEPADHAEGGAHSGTDSSRGIQSGDGGLCKISLRVSTPHTQQGSDQSARNNPKKYQLQREGAVLHRVRVQCSR